MLALPTNCRKRCVKYIVCLDNGFVLFTAANLLYLVVPKLPKEDKVGKEM